MQGIFFEDFKSSFIPDILKEIYIDKIYAMYLDGRSDLTIVDIGANVGLFTFYVYPFAKKIYAIEPSQQHLKVFKQMLSFNDMEDKVTVVEKAIFYEDKKMQLHHNANTTMFSLSKVVGDPKLGIENVTATRMDTLFTQYSIDHVHFLKLDIEGAEVDVIGGEGFEKVADKIDAMVVEYHDWSARSPTQLITTLHDYGFKTRIIPSSAKLIGAVRT